MNPSRPKAESGGGAGGEEAEAAAEEGGGGTPTSAAAAAAPAGSDPNSEEALLQVRTRIDWQGPQGHTWPFSREVAVSFADGS